MTQFQELHSAKGCTPPVRTSRLMFYALSIKKGAIVRLAPFLFGIFAKSPNHQITNSPATSSAV